MAENKKSFILYADWLESFEDLSDEEAGILIKHILRYVNDKNPKTNDRVVKAYFMPIKRQLKQDLQKWEDIKSKRSDAGRKGGQAKQANARSAKQKVANLAVTVNVNDNVILLEQNKSELRQFSEWHNALLKLYQTDKKELKVHLDIFILEMEASGELAREFDEVRKHFKNWLRHRDIKKFKEGPIPHWNEDPEYWKDK